MSHRHATVWVLCYLKLPLPNNLVHGFQFGLIQMTREEVQKAARCVCQNETWRASSLVLRRVLFPSESLWVLYLLSAFLSCLQCFPLPPKWPIKLSLLYSKVSLAHRSRLFQLLPNYTSSHRNKPHSQWQFCSFITLSCCYDDPSLRKEDFILAHGLRVPPIMAGKAP